MDKKQRNLFNMMKVVRAWITANLAALNHLPHLVTTFEQFCAGLDKLIALDEGKAIKTQGLSESKANSRARLEKEVLELISILKAYATFSDNVVLLNEIDFTRTQLTKVAETVLLVRSQKVIHAAEAHQTDASEYDLSAERLENTKVAYDDFNTKQSSVREAIVSRKDAGEQLDAQMDELNDILKSKLDVLLDLIENSQPELYNQYQAARIIVDR